MRKETRCLVIGQSTSHLVLTWLPGGSDCSPLMFWYGSLSIVILAFLPRLFADVQALELTNGLQEGRLLEELGKGLNVLVRKVCRLLVGNVNPSRISTMLVIRR